MVVFSHNTVMKKSKKKLKLIYGVKKIMQSRFDEEGSYTGTAEMGEKPVQDADDL